MRYFYISFVVVFPSTLAHGSLLVEGNTFPSVVFIRAMALEQVPKDIRMRYSDQHILVNPTNIFEFQSRDDFEAFAGTSIGTDPEETKLKLVKSDINTTKH